MKIIVTYNSKNGFTEKYAKWIAEALNCKALSAAELKNVSEYDLVIHGGWIMGGMISGFENIKKLNPHNLITFGVGFTKDDNYVATVRETNHTGDIPTFYFQGGMNPAKMGFFGKFIVKMVTKNKPQYEDSTNRETIQALVDYVNGLDR